VGHPTTLDLSGTVPAAVEHAAKVWRDHPALRWKEAGAWRTMTWRDYRDQVMAAARGLVSLGFQPGDGLVILAGNRPEWMIADLASIVAGGLPTGLYTTATAAQCAFVAGHCGASVAVVEHAGFLAQLEGVRDRLRAVVVMSGEAGGCLGWGELLELGRRSPGGELAARIAALDPERTCTTIYTSGTTGAPKGVMLSHRNLLWTAGTLAADLGIDSSYRGLSYLPLSHVAEQIVSLFAGLVTGGCIAFAASLETVLDDLRDVRPTFFFAVPRVWEKIQARMEAAGAHSSPLRRRLVGWARRIGREAGAARQCGEPVPGSYWLADRLIFRKVRRLLGFDRTEYFITSAAPIGVETLEFFLSLGITILEVYGMTECSGPATLSRPDRFRVGSAGLAMPGTEIKLTEEGEICMRGPHVFLGYSKDPEATQEALDGDGWLHSGDIGTIDDEGFLRIVDRKKEIIITSGGKNVAPVPIELKLKAVPGVAQAVVVGERRKYLTALLTLDPEQISDIAARIGSPARTVAEAATCAGFRGYLEEAVAAINATLASYETIKRFAILSGELSIDDGTLTPTLKLRRRNVDELYRDLIESLYSDGAEAHNSGIA
jgi:long-subunit acyl-CoA synthetase (AMP-forming)